MGMSSYDQNIVLHSLLRSPERLDLERGVTRQRLLLFRSNVEELMWPRDENRETVTRLPVLDNFRATFMRGGSMTLVRSYFNYIRRDYEEAFERGF